MALYRCGGGDIQTSNQEWINASPSSTFAAQTIPNIVVNDKDTVTVCAIPSTNFVDREDLRVPRAFVVTKGSSYTLESNGTSKVRTMTVNSDGTITIGNVTTGVGDNTFCIPVYLIVTAYKPIS